MKQAFRASIVHCLDDPGAAVDGAAVEYLDDGLLLVEDGRVSALAAADTLLPDLPAGTALQDLRGRIIAPGFIDCHVHYAQLCIIASYGRQLLDWLDDYAYPEETRFSDPQYAEAIAARFVQQLLQNGTTSALVFATVFPQSVDAIFAAAKASRLRLLAGKVLMDRNCPQQLADDPHSAYADSRALIERWHGQDRLGYAITPRFALTSSDAQLQAAGKLASEFPDTWVHTHLAENHDEITQIAQLFPGSRSYLDVYDRAGLLRERAVFAHCLHLDAADRSRLAEAGAAAAFCPSSNLFLGSGLFDLDAMHSEGIRVGLATDVGGGTSLSMLRTMGDAYKVLQLNGQSLPASRALYLATLGAARALRLDRFIGNFEPGKEADFVLLDDAASSASAIRAESATGIDERLFSLMFAGDDRHVAATYVLGERVAFSD